MPATVEWCILRFFKLSTVRFYRGLKDRENTVSINLIASRWTALALLSKIFFQYNNNSITVELR